jgi:hypothetical protein
MMHHLSPKAPISWRRFYLDGQGARGQELAAPVKSLLIAHGVAMTAWMLLFLVQPLLIAGSHRRVHMALGLFGAGLAACIVPLGLWTAIAVTKVEPDVVRFGLNRTQFLALQFNGMLTFGTFAGIGILNHRRSEIHRPMMLLATFTIMAAATSRITARRELELHVEAVWGPLFGPNLIVIAIGAVFLAIKTALTRSFDRWLAGGSVLMAIVCALAMRIGPTATWERIGSFSSADVCTPLQSNPGPHGDSPRHIA